MVLLLGSQPYNLNLSKPRHVMVLLLGSQRYNLILGKPRDRMVLLWAVNLTRI